ncbi:Fe(2+) transporter permease subunit FeoB [Phormidium sp. FACHB-1136]|uniref:Fe(2+) transporter permease subunit FeoB n=1 Tax=Phormidium sp. FACHB-1136 TaxID=2692848 RepID=UPI001685D72B|nr:Fe(2+) transporter permease subunit FeoB [Phormidium sp. FACHB-1136]MBD2429100.1 Fe(2+) transporter permease subunit FeoB [Phormidium sp. FACHB-1136]
MTSSTIALLGNPNCGKTTLFNALTGANQRVGNWPGVTVDRKEGSYRHGDQTVTVVDLPGIYAIDSEDEGSLDEAIARDYLLTGAAQVVVNIVDAANLERNLYLTTQLLEMDLPLVVALNMMDAAAEQGVRINPEHLAERLGCPVVPMVAARGQGVEDLRHCLATVLPNPQKPTAQVIYPTVLEEALAALTPALAGDQAPTRRDRWLALKLLEYDDSHGPDLPQAVVQQVAEQRHRIHQVLGEDIDIAVADSRYGYAHRLVSDVAHRPRQVSLTRSDKIDQIVLNRWLGIPIFLGVMYLLFMFAINVGSAFIDFFDILFGTIFVDGLGHVLTALGMPDLVTVVLANGMGGGIQTVATFIPVIACLFLFMACLEDSGYMSRAAFVMDRFMRFVGLPGKSFVPMLVGFGCNVPAIMATRTLESRRDRILTILMNPFMSCGARLPVYALFAAAFFPRAGQNIVFLLYLVGMGMAVVTGLIMKHTLLKGEAAPFVMELPTYHLPTLKGVLLRTWERLKSFILRAGQVIVVMVMVLSLLNSIGVDGSIGNEDSENSVLSALSQRVTPAFAPMGIAQDNWPATVGIFTGVFAKEAVVGTLDSLYSQLARDEAAAAGVDLGDDEFDFFGNIGAAFATVPANLAALGGTLLDPLGLSIGDVSTLDAAAAEQAVTYTTFGQMVTRFDGRIGAFAYLLFILMYFPCVAAMGAVFRETNAGWTAFVGLWTTALAYWSATLFYQVMTFPRHPASSAAWVAALTAVAVATILLLRFSRPARRRRRALSLEGLDG